VRPVLVVVRHIARKHDLQLSPPRISIRSSSSRRTVPTHRSENAFARGARSGVRRIRMPWEPKIASKVAASFASRSDQEADLPDAVCQVHEEVPGLLGEHASVGLVVMPMLLKRADIEPAPRRTGLTSRRFLSAQAQGILA
jgi:hypothetical protein